jgi:hypothetical protein
MDPVVQIINSLTNIAGIYPLTRFYVTNDVLGFILTLCAIAGSIGMHLFERKHKLTGFGVSVKVSNILLRIDNCTAIMVTIYGLILCYNNDRWNEALPILLPAYVFLILGELTNNLIAYTVCHSIWHVAAYYTIGIVV